MIKLLLFGFPTWLVPFVVLAQLAGRDGEPIPPTGMFKSVTIVIGSADPDYAGEIALRYLVIPIMAVVIGALDSNSGDTR
jgi:hypothetical protein